MFGIGSKTVLHALGAETANGTADIALTGEIPTEMWLATAVTAKAGTTPTLKLILSALINDRAYELAPSEHLKTVGAGTTTSWVTDNKLAASFGDEVGQWIARFSRIVPVPNFRFAWTIGGTGSPSYTFESFLLW